MKQRLKQLLFRALGKDPEAVIAAISEPVAAEMRRLVPDRRVILVTPETARAQLRPFRLALFAVPVEHWRTAFAIAPTKVLAFHPNLDRHHLKLRNGIASLLFLRGVPLDRIFLRPKWLYPFKHDRSRMPDEIRVLEGRPSSPQRREVSVLTPYFPYPLSHGGAVRMFNLLRAASDKFDITLLSFTETGECIEPEPLLAFCRRLVLVEKPYYREPRWSTIVPPEVAEYESPAMRRAVAEYGRPLLQTEYTALARYGGQVLVEHDVTFDLAQQVAANSTLLSNRWNLWRWRRFELHQIRHFCRIVVMSEKDRDLLGTGVVIPNGVDLDRYQPTPEKNGRNILFVGSFRHFPNVTAIRWFLSNIWPHLSDCTLTIVAGPDADRYYQIPQLDRVTKFDFVADVRPLYDETNCVIVPTLVSAGTNIKVLEAMAMRRAVVSTPSGVNGLGVTHAENAWVAESPIDFTEGVRFVLGHPEIRSRLAEAGRQHAEQFDWRILGEKQKALWRELL